MILVLATVLLPCALLTGPIGRVFCWDTTQRHAAGRASMTTLALLLVFGGFFGPSHTVAAALPALGVVPSILAASTASGELQAGREVSPAALVPRGKTRLYRAVSQAELEDVEQFGFRPGPGAMETKLFATSAEDASFFARNVLFPLDKKPLTILEVEVPEGLASRLFRFTADGKPTVALDPALLQEFNAVARVRPLNYSPLPSF